MIVPASDEVGAMVVVELRAALVRSGTGVVVVVLADSTGFGGRSSSVLVPMHSIYDARHSRRVQS